MQIRTPFSLAYNFEVKANSSHIPEEKISSQSAIGNLPNSFYHKNSICSLVLKSPFHSIPGLLSHSFNTRPIHTVKGLYFGKFNSDYAIIAPKRPSQIASSNTYSPEEKQINIIQPNGQPNSRKPKNVFVSVRVSSS